MEKEKDILPFSEERDNFKNFKTVESLMKAIDKRSDVQFIYGLNEIVVIEVFSHRTIREFATQRWAIVNQKFYEMYVTQFNAKQYLVFDFNKPVDDPFRLIGVTDYPVEQKRPNVAHTYMGGRIITEKVENEHWYTEVMKNKSTKEIEFEKNKPVVEHQQIVVQSLDNLTNDLKNDLTGCVQLLNEMFRWAKVKDGRAIFTTSEETWKIYQKFVGNLRVDAEGNIKEYYGKPPKFEPLR